MSWRKGFFRLWVLVSIVWLIAVGSIFFEDIARPVFEGRGFYYSSKEPRDLLATQARKGARYAEEKAFYLPKHSSEYRDFEMAAKAGTVEIVRFDDIPEVVLFLSVGLPIEVASSRTNEIHRIAKRIENLVVSKRRFEAIKTASAIGLTPPIALLLIGVGVGWALSGFRRQS